MWSWEARLRPNRSKTIFSDLIILFWVNSHYTLLESHKAQDIYHFPILSSSLGNINYFI